MKKLRTAVWYAIFYVGTCFSALGDRMEGIGLDKLDEIDRNG